MKYLQMLTAFLLVLIFRGVIKNSTKEFSLKFSKKKQLEFLYTIRTHTHTHTHIYTHTYIYIYIYIYVCVCVCVFISFYESFD